MSGGYTSRSYRVEEDGYQFDSILERDWAGFIAHTGLRWRREPFNILPEHKTTHVNIVARPDFFLPDVAVVFECKPTRDHVTSNEAKWRNEANRMGLPVVVTEGKPQPEWIGDSRWRVLMPPALWAYREDGAPLQTYFAHCPDCLSVGLVSISESTTGWLEALVDELDDKPPATPLTELWLSACHHQPRWSMRSLTDGIAGFQRGVGTVERVA
jgi:hypothetical protein